MTSSRLFCELPRVESDISRFIAASEVSSRKDVVRRGPAVSVKLDDVARFDACVEDADGLVF